MIFIYCCFQYGHEASLMSEKWAQYMSQNSVTPKSAPCLALQHGVISISGYCSCYRCFKVSLIHSGGSRISHWGHGPLTRVLFSENMCENKRIGSHGGMGWAHPLDLPMVNPTVESTDHVDKFHESGKFYATPHHLELNRYVLFVVL